MKKALTSDWYQYMIPIRKRNRARKVRAVKIFQKGFNYSQDGQGNRLVYHLQGCNMKCPWCSNPEGMPIDGVIISDEEWLLESVCPHHAVTGTQVDRSVCRTCEKRECITEHRTKGLYLSYEEMSAQELLEEAKANEMMFYDGGGVTFTGGEATVQYEELKEVLMGLKSCQIHTAIETNGTHPGLPELFPHIGQLIMDCKLCDPQEHRRWTGISNERILRNIREAARCHPKLHVRVPLIGGVNDSAEAREAFLGFFREIKGENVTFEVLAYHAFGEKKWGRCGRSYQMTDEAYVDEGVLKSFRETICQTGVRYERT